MRANNILTLPGSDSINALLFSNKNTKIIQMIPWPNSLMSNNKYSLIVAFSQFAFQTALNVTPYYGTPLDSRNNNFDDLFHYGISDLESLLAEIKDTI